MMNDTRLRPRDNNGDRRRRHTGVHAVAGRRRLVHPVKRENEQRCRDDIGELADAGHHACSPVPGFLTVLNIFNIRSVIRNPLTMFVIEANSATAPMMRNRIG